MSAASNTTALGGLRVVELAGGLAPAFVGNVFADFGADVAFVEPRAGAALRTSAAFPFLARGKHSIGLDVALPADLAALHRLIASADVLVESVPGDGSAVLGAPAEELLERHPRLVHVHISGFGPHGPYAALAPHEGLVMARIGGNSAFGGLADREGPAHVSVPFCEFSAAQAALHGALAALLERERTGRGQRVESSLLRGIASLDVWNWFLNLLTTRYADAFLPAPHVENGVPNSALIYRLLIALSEDGQWLQFSQTSRHLYVALMEVLGFGWMFDDPVWSAIPLVDDPERRVELWDRMLEAVRARPADEWARVFDEFPNVWAERFRRGSELLDHPQMVHDRNVVLLHDAERGAVRQPGPIAQLRQTPGRADRSAPRLDASREHLSTWLPRQQSVGAGAPGGRAPLEGVTVLELGMYFAAPFGGSLLADLGARVIKIESLEGDPLRSLASFPEIGAIKAVQGKECVALDLSTPEGQRIVHEIAAEADLVIQSFRAGVAERLHVDAATLRAVNPDLVYVHAPGYGVDGPCGHRPAYAPTIAAASGIALRLAGPTLPENPTELTTAQEKDAAVRLVAATNTSFAQCDGLSALAVATSALLALLARARGAGGQDVFTSMLLTASHVNCEDVVAYTDRPATPSPDRDLLGLHATYRLYECAEGWVFLAAPDVDEWAALVAHPAFAHLSFDARFADTTHRHDADAELAKELSAVFAGRAALDWEDQLVPNGVGCVAVRTDRVESILMSDEFGRAGDLVADVEHPMLGEHPRLAPVVTFSRSVTTPRGGSSVGQHTRPVVAELGYSETEIDDLVTRRVIATA
jgi:crotonobetainyl-CoA:carnitine CoA-transferase CaiB-like acyl-CoA transferase